MFKVNDILAMRAPEDWTNDKFRLVVIKIYKDKYLFDTGLILGIEFVNSEFKKVGTYVEKKHA